MHSVYILAHLIFFSSPVAMFQRISSAINARIAEEQARQKAAQESISRSSSTRRTAAGTPTRTGSRARPDSSNNAATTPPSRGPDPTEFDPEFVIDDDDGISSSGISTPRVEKEKLNLAEAGSADTKGDAAGNANSTATATTTTATTGGDSESSQKGGDPAEDKKTPAAAAPGTVTKAEAEPKAASTSELPHDVRVRLRRLDKLESKYQGISI